MPHDTEQAHRIILKSVDNLGVEKWLQFSDMNGASPRSEDSQAPALKASPTRMSATTAPRVPTMSGANMRKKPSTSTLWSMPRMLPATRQAM
jgi:hypothetical protein